MFEKTVTLSSPRPPHLAQSQRSDMTLGVPFPPLPFVLREDRGEGKVCLNASGHRVFSEKTLEASSLPF